MKQSIVILIAALLFTACESGPSEAEIGECVLRELDCGKYAKLNELNVISKKEEQLLGFTTYRVVVEGEVEYVSNCRSFLQGDVIAGEKQKLGRRTIFLHQEDDAWVCP